MNINKQTFNTLDVLYDDKKWGKRIDPDEWNANFKVLEEGHNELATKLNQQVTDIDTAIQATTSNGGQNISVQYGVGTETLQDALDNVVSDINNRYTKNEVDASIGSNTNSLIANAEYNESTGVFTFTRKDGSSVVIDTVIEKVPASMALVNESDGSVSLVVTNQDGSTTKTNVTSLIEDTVINSSDTVNATSVTDAVKKVTTYTLVIKPNSIGLSHIDSALTAKFEETQSAKSAAIQAKDNAVAAQNAAIQAKNNAETYASNANTYSTNASVSANESADSALEAKGYAEQAASYKNSAELAKTASIQAKNDSETAKTDAQTAATEASKSKTAAEQSATSASHSASSASQSATSASNSSTSALQSKEAAALSEINSLANKNASAESASAAATSETNAASSALAAQTAQTAAEKARDEAQAIAGGAYATKVELNEHANNVDIHVTAEEKAAWSKSDVFIAEYGTTTSAEIEAAYQAGKAVYCLDKSTTPLGFYSLTRISTAGHFAYFDVAIGQDLSDFGFGKTVQAIRISCTQGTWNTTKYVAATSEHASAHASDGTDPIIPASIGAAAISTTTEATLAAASWSGVTVPYTYTLSVSGVTASSNQEIIPSLDITQEQLEAIQGANIVDGGQAAGFITLKAWGDKPSVDIPIRVIKRGD